MEEVGGLLEINDSWVKFIRNIDYTDLDKATDVGYYSVNGTSNYPSASEPGLNDWGSLLVFGQIKTQLFIPGNVNAVMFIRKLLSPGWTKWSKFTGTLLTI